ncbi:MAG: SurA N-terminal domain-containing protein [Oligoflexales bacterium]
MATTFSAIYKNQNSYIYQYVALFWLSLTPTIYAQNWESLDGIAAKVDQQVILHSEIQEKVQRGPLVMISPYPAVSNSSQYEQALQDSINLALVIKESEQLDIGVSDEEVEQKIQTILQKQNLSESTLRELLSREGKTYEDYFSDFRKNMVLQKFQGRVIWPRVKVSDKDVETYFMSKARNNRQQELIQFRQILIRVPSGSSEDIWKKKSDLAKDVHWQLLQHSKSNSKNTDDFIRAVKMHSDASNASKNEGLLPEIGLNGLTPILRDALKDLQEGEIVTQPVKTPQGFFILRLEKRSFGGGQKFQNMREALYTELRQKRIQEQLETWLMQARQKTRIHITSKNT